MLILKKVAFCPEMVKNAREFNFILNIIGHIEKSSEKNGEKCMIWQAPSVSINDIRFYWYILAIY
jgi:hypothetical protein